MTWFHGSILANIVLTIGILFLVRDRQYFKSVCQLRHNPIDKAIIRIEESIGKIWDKLNES
jgi:hypothetical protein